MPRTRGFGSGDAGQPIQGLATDADVAPLIQKLGAYCLVEVDGRGIPVEDFPLQAGTAFWDGDGGNPLQQRLANAEAAKLWMNEDVFEINSGAALPCGVVEEVEGKAGRLPLTVGYQAVINGVRAESVAQQAFFGRSYGVRLPLKGGQGSNKCQNLRDIGFGRCPDRGCNASILGDVEEGKSIVGGLGRVFLSDPCHTSRPLRRTTMEP